MFITGQGVNLDMISMLQPGEGALVGSTAKALCSLDLLGTSRKGNGATLKELIDVNRCSQMLKDVIDINLPMWI